MYQSIPIRLGIFPGTSFVPPLLSEKAPIPDKQIDMRFLRTAHNRPSRMFFLLFHSPRLEFPCLLNSPFPGIIGCTE